MSEIEPLNVLDTDYADIVANSYNPVFELNIVKLGMSPAEARVKTKFVTLLSRKPQTQEEWDELFKAWEEACGYRPKPEHLELLARVLWQS